MGEEQKKLGRNRRRQKLKRRWVLGEKPVAREKKRGVKHGWPKNQLARRQGVRHGRPKIPLAMGRYQEVGLKQKLAAKRWYAAGGVRESRPRKRAEGAEVGWRLVRYFGHGRQCAGRDARE